MADSSQKFISRNRAPRVQIEYDVELYGSEKKVQLPFVMGVMSDLTGNSRVEQPAVADRKFLEIDVDNFDERMKAMAPRAAFSVPNTLTGEGNLAVDLTFESMSDFSPGAIAAKVDALRPLLEARSQLQNLMAYMDGKSGAEALIEAILNDPGLLAAVSAPPQDSENAAALDSLRDLALPQEAADTADDVLDVLRSHTPEEGPGDDSSAEVLAGLQSTAPDVSEGPDQTETALSSLSQGGGPAPDTDDADPSDILDALAESGSTPEREDDTAETLRTLAAVERDEAPEAVSDDPAAAALDSLAGAAMPEADDDDDATSVLDDLAESAPSDPEEVEDLDALLGTLAGEVPQQADAGRALDETLESLAAAEFAPDEPDRSEDVLADLSAAQPKEDAQNTDDLDAILGELERTEDTVEEPDPDDALNTLEPLAETEDEAETLDELLADLGAEGPQVEAATAGEAALESLMPAGDARTETAEEADLAELLGEEGENAPTVEQAESGTTDAVDDLDALLGEVGESESAETLDDLLADLGADTEAENTAAAADSDLDALLGDLETDAAPDDGSDLGLDELLTDLEADVEAGSTATAQDGDLEALLREMATDAAPDDDSDLDLEDLLTDLDEDEDADSGTGDDLDALLGDLDIDANVGSAEADATAQMSDLSGGPEFAYGTLAAERPKPQKLARKRFRLAVLGDFSGRAAKGLLETGEALATRRAILLDADTVDDVIEGFATELVLPIGKDGAGIAVKLADLDDLHPDELYENVAIFSELSGLRKQLQSGATADHAAATLRAWAEKHGTRARAPKRTSAGNAVPADRRLSAFQKLIGDSGNSLRQPSPVEDLLARVVGPHVRALPDPDAAAMQTAVDEALSDAMRLVLHHPEFQSLEAQWRSLDLIARSIEDDDTLDVMLYDISAEELAADLAANDDLSGTGLVRLLTEEPLDEDNGRGGYSALIGMYQFEETPPHAELLGRIARVAAHVDAPFFAGISPEFLTVPKVERPRLVAEAWDTLRQMPEAGHLGLVSPRFLLRRPYGQKSDPCHTFDFEEFTEREGLKGMLWANPVVLVAILLARSFKRNGPSMQLGQIMTLGGMPYHYVTDRFGDQVALPCTERNIDLDKITLAQERGIMAVSAVKGRDELRLTSFNSMKGEEILGPWTGVPAPEPSPADPREARQPEAGDAADTGQDAAELDLSDLGLEDDGEDDGLDELLSSFQDGDGGDDGGDEDMDAELAALLEDL